MTLDDAILAATGGPTVTDGLWAYFFSELGSPPELAGASLQDLERAFLRVQMPAEDGSNSDLWFTYLSETEGHEGSLSDMLLAFWSAFSAGTAPSNDTLPVVTGTPQSSNTLTCSTGVWTDAESYGYRWLDSGTPIIGETQSSLTLNSSYIGKDISCRVTASNNWGSADAESNTVTVLT
mgnify:FL=1